MVIITYSKMWYIGLLTHLQTIDPNIQRDIQELF